MLDLIKFIIEVIKRKLIVWHYNAIKHTHKESLAPYLKYKDTITDIWYIFGDYERHINSAIDSYTKKGYQNFFIDVGANIGLTTILNWKKFDILYCLEPNDLVFNIMKTNIAISCDKEKVKLFNVGLGLKRGKYTLKVPKHNFGGAFIKENNLQYQFDKAENHIDVQVNIESEDFLNENIFNTFKAEHKGIIKIDVEGYELEVLELIVRTIHVNKIVIIFENWQTLDRKIIEKIIKNSNFTSFKIGHIKWFSSLIQKIKSKSTYSNILFLDDNENFLPKECVVIIELEE